MKPYSNLAELIEMLETDIISLTEQIETLKQAPKSVNEQIILTYIDTRSTGKTKDYVRTLGLLSDRGTLYSSGDVSKLIQNGAEDISPKLLAIAQKVVNIKKKDSRKR